MTPIQINKTDFMDFAKWLQKEHNALSFVRMADDPPSTTIMINGIPVAHASWGCDHTGSGIREELFHTFEVDLPLYVQHIRS